MKTAMTVALVALGALTAIRTYDIVKDKLAKDDPPPSPTDHVAEIGDKLKNLVEVVTTPLNNQIVSMKPGKDLEDVKRNSDLLVSNMMAFKGTPQRVV